MGALRLSLGVMTLFSTLSFISAMGDSKISVVTYGSTIKLEHKSTNHRLHSHEISYNTGSGQQSVTAHHDHGDSNSFWIIRAPHEANSIASGTSVNCGDTIRLQHLRTSKNLHSHDHRAPMNRENEVSAYGLTNGRWAEGDDGDNWIVECIGRSKEWQRAADVRLRHAVTKAYLSSSSSLRYSDPIPNQLQVSGSNRKNANTIWRTNEGFYVAPLKQSA